MKIFFALKGSKLFIIIRYLSGLFWGGSCLFGLRTFSLYFEVIVILVISHFGFEGGALVLIASFSGHCLSFPFFNKITL